MRPRWKGFSEFMFWGCFTSDKKGPCHIWRPETMTEKKAAAEVLESREIEARFQWKLETGVWLMGLRHKPGLKPKWRRTESTGKLIRREKGNGVDWYRYQTQILMPSYCPSRNNVRLIVRGHLFRKIRRLHTLLGTYSSVRFVP